MLSPPARERTLKLPAGLGEPPAPGRNLASGREGERTLRGCAEARVSAGQDFLSRTGPLLRLVQFSPVDRDQGQHRKSQHADKSGSARGRRELRLHDGRIEVAGQEKGRRVRNPGQCVPRRRWNGLQGDRRGRGRTHGADALEPEGALQQRRRRPERPDAVRKRSLVLADLHQRQPAPQRFLVTGQRRGPRRTVRRQRLSADHVVAEQAQPAANGRDLAGVHVGVPVPRHEIDDAGHVTGAVRVTYRLVRGARPAVPGAGALMQGGHDFRFGAAELTAEHLGEEMVIAEPLPGVVEWHDEEVFPFEDVDNLGRVGRSGHGITQRRAKSAQDRGAHEKLPHLARLAAEHLLGQKLFDKPAVAAELADDVTGRRAPVQQ